MTDWTGNGATLRTETLAIPVLPGLRCSPPARHAAIRQILLFHPAGIPDPASSQPARQAPGSQTAATPPPPRTGKHPRKPVTQRGRPGSPTDHPPSHLLCRDPGPSGGSPRPRRGKLASLRGLRGLIGRHLLIGPELQEFTGAEHLWRDVTAKYPAGGQCPVRNQHASQKLVIADWSELECTQSGLM